MDGRKDIWIKLVYGNVPPIFFFPVNIFVKVVTIFFLFFCFYPFRTLPSLVLVFLLLFCNPAGPNFVRYSTKIQDTSS